MTKYVATEGTGIIAYDHEKTLIKKGVEVDVIEKAKRMIYDTTVYPEGKILLEKFNEHIHAMHDPTEGGIFTALNEIADASNTGLKIYQDNIPVKEETIIICEAFNISPYLLLSSGVLLVIVDRNFAEEIRKHIEREGIKATIIGEVTEEPNKRLLIKNGVVSSLPRQEKDEIWKLL